MPVSPSSSPMALQKFEQTCLARRGCSLDPSVLSVRTHMGRYETKPFSLFICPVVDKCLQCSFLFFKLPFPRDYAPLFTLRWYELLCFLIGRNVAWPSQSSLSSVTVISQCFHLLPCVQSPIQNVSSCLDSLTLPRGHQHLTCQLCAGPFLGESGPYL